MEILLYMCYFMNFAIMAGNFRRAVVFADSSKVFTDRMKSVRTKSILSLRESDQIIFYKTMKVVNKNACNMLEINGIDYR